jgi:hypothetical protein
MSFDDALAVADAVLFEGYALYPYRPSALKNRMRWQFGVLAPRAWSEAGGGDPWWQETQLLVRRAGVVPTILSGRLRFLRLRPPAGGSQAGSKGGWDEGEVRAFDFALPIASDGATEAQVIPLSLPAGRLTGEEGETRTWPITGAIHLAAEPVAAAEPLSRVRIRVENLTAWTTPDAPRDEALRGAMLGTHLLLSTAAGVFLSAIDPPAWAAAATAACRNTRTNPVLVGRGGRRDLVLSAPIVLPDHPEVAPESPGDLFDATEIDEILTLRILTLTEAEKAEVRATDPRLAALLDRAERLTPEAMARLHGARRELRRVPNAAAAKEVPTGVRIAGRIVGPGSRVRLHPGPRRADAQDMFLAGRSATVEAVMSDVDQGDCLAVTIDDDPAAEVLRWRGQFHYFRPDEVEPMDPDAR